MNCRAASSKSRPFTGTTGERGRIPVVEGGKRFASDRRPREPHFMDMLAREPRDRRRVRLSIDLGGRPLLVVSPNKQVRESPAVVPTECVQLEALSLSESGVYDLGEDDVVITFFEHVHQLALDPARAIREDGQAGRSSVRPHFVEGFVEDLFRELTLQREDDRSAGYSRSGAGVLITCQGESTRDLSSRIVRGYSRHD